MLGFIESLRRVFDCPMEIFRCTVACVVQMFWRDRVFTLPCARRTQRLEIEGAEISGLLAL